MKKITILLFCLGSALLTQAQPYYPWRVSAGVGGASYYGEVSAGLKTTRISWPAYQISLARSVSPSFDLELNASWGRFSANDRARDWRGNWQTSNADFTRGLNFETQFRSANLLLQYNFNNGYLLSAYARLAPYVFVGGGITDFTVYGDLRNAAGQMYHYWSDNTVRDQPEGTPDAVVITQDHDFETKLSGTENGASYATRVATIPAGLGLRWRISERFSTDLRAETRYAFTDYLDHAKGGNRHDLYFAGSASLTYHFNWGRDQFRAPVAYVGNEPQPGNQSLSPMTAQTQPQVQSLRKITPDTTVQRLATQHASAPSQLLVPVEAVPVADSIYAPDSTRRSATWQAIRQEDWDTLAARDRVVRGKTDSRLNPVALPMDTVLTEAYGNRQGKPQETGNKTVVRDTAPPLPAPIVTRNQPKNKPTDTVNSIRRQTVNPGSPADEARMQRLEEQMAQLNRKLAALRNQPANQTGAPRQNQQELTRLENQMEDLNRQLRNTDRVARTDYMRSRNREQNQTAVELAAVTAQLNRLKKQQKQLTTDQSTEQKLDSLLQQVTALQIRLDTAVSRQTAAAPKLSTTSAAKDSVPTNLPTGSYQGNLDRTGSYSTAQATASPDTTLLTVRNQLRSLQQMVDELQTQLTAGNETVKRYAPYGTLVIYYPVNSAQLNNTDQQRLAVLAAQLESDSAAVLQIKGFADPTGNASYNLELSRKRAETVQHYLLSRFRIKPRQVLINYFGQAKTTTTTANPYDRRVELELYTAGQ